VVGSRKRTATEQDHRGQDRTRVPVLHDGNVTANSQGRLYDQGRFSSIQQSRFHQEGRVSADKRSSNDVGGCVSSSEWHGSGAITAAEDHSSKASFYVTNFLDSLTLFRLRQAFEVCGILTDVYVSRYQNAHGQEFGFVRYVNVKNSDKLSKALNNV